MSVAPSSVELPAGGMQTFAAITGGKVSEDNITWTIEGHTSKDTSITKGVLNIGADEEAAWITVRAAASKDDEFGTALVTIKSAAGNPADDPAGDNSGTPEKPAIPDGGGGGSASITVSIIEPYTRDIKKGQSNNFSLTVNQSAGGSYQVAQVIWNVSGAKSADTSIDSGGRLFIAEGESATTLNISADFAGATSNIVPINVIPDLSKWESASSVFTGLSGNIIAIARSDNMLVFLSDTSTVYPYTYTDGDFKVEDGVTLSGLKSEEKISTIAYGGKGAAAYFVAGGDKGTLLYSQDAKTWRKAGGDDFSGAVNRIRYLDGEINTFVALCSNDAIFSAPTGSMDTWTKTIFSFDGALSFSDIIIVEGASSVALICNDRYDNKDYGVIYTAEIKSKFNDLSWSRPHRVSETGAILSLAASVPGTNEFAVAGNNRLYIYTYDGAAISDPVSDDDPGFYSVNDMLFQKIGDGYIYFITASIGGIQYLENGVDIQTISPITNDALYWLNAITYFKPVNKFIAAGYSGYVVFTK
jgi:hypothetical protein